MQITERDHQGIIVLDLQGRLTTGDAGAERVRDKITSLFFQGHSKVLVNLGGVPHIDSGGLGELVRCSLIARRANGSIKLFGLTHRVVELLTITKLITEFDTFETEREALASFMVAA